MNIHFIHYFTVQVTSFSITDIISGSITSYSIFYGSNIIQNKPACANRTCEYTVAPSSCLTTDPIDVDVTVAAANVLGLGPSTESFTIGTYLIYDKKYKVCD